MDVNGEGESTGIYIKEFSGGKKQYILLNTDSEDTSVIVLTGQLTLQDIKNVMDK